MEFFHQKTQFDFIGTRWIAFCISGALTLVAVGALATKGLNKSIDFVGGTMVKVSYTAKGVQDISGLRADLDKAGYGHAAPQHFMGSDSFQIRLKGEVTGEAEKNRVEEFVKALRAADPAKVFVVDSQEYVGPTVGRHLFKQAMLATVLSLLGIAVYVAFRFDNPVWGLGGIISLAHDVVAAAGLMSILGLEFDLTLVATLLTIAGYSINDTIVIYDRIRERMNIHRKDPLETQINVSINETLSRTIITVLTVLITLVILLVWGGHAIHDFALTMTFGVVVGMYSSIAVATPIVYEWEHRKKAGQPPVAEPLPAVEGGKPGRRNRR